MSYSQEGNSASLTTANGKLSDDAGHTGSWNGKWYSGARLNNNGADLLRIGVGVLDLGLGAAVTLGSGGVGTIAGVGLMSVGIDQILTGVMNIGSGTRAMSVYEFGGYSGAQGLGYGEGTSQVIGALTPAALTAILAGIGLASLGGGSSVGGGAAGGGSPNLIQLTSGAGRSGIEASGQLYGHHGIFALPATAANQHWLLRAFRSGLPGSRVAEVIPIPEAALPLFSRPIPIGLYSGWKYFSGVYYSSAGSINMATGAFTPWPTWIGPGMLIYGPDLAAYGFLAGIGGLYWYVTSR